MSTPRQLNDTPSGDQRMMDLISRTLFAEALTRSVQVKGGCAPNKRFTSNRASDLTMIDVGSVITSVTDVSGIVVAATCA